MKEELRPRILWFGVLLASVAVPLTRATANPKPHTRQKRLLWLTADGRLALPPGTTLVITPTLGMPFVRYPPDGFLSNMTISLPFTIQFDKLGLTDNQNPYGVLPPTLDRSMGRAAGVMVADYVAKVINSRRHSREAPKAPPEANFHGGERALLYAVVEDFLSSFGMDGKACLLRAICEVHGHRMDNFGLVGEVLKLFFTASRSPFADVLHEYVDAEESGLQHGECWRYYKSCSKSLFLWHHQNKYGAESSHEAEEEGATAFAADQQEAAENYLIPQQRNEATEAVPAAGEDQLRQKSPTGPETTTEDVRWENKFPLLTSDLLLHANFREIFVSGNSTSFRRAVALSSEKEMAADSEDSRRFDRFNSRRKFQGKKKKMSGVGEISVSERRWKSAKLLSESPFCLASLSLKRSAPDFPQDYAS